MADDPGVVWCTGQFWALYVLQRVSKVDPLTPTYIVGAALLLARLKVPTLIMFGELDQATPPALNPLISSKVPSALHIEEDFIE